MAMDVDLERSDFEAPPSDPPPKKTTTRGKKTAAPAKKATTKVATKAPVRGKGKKAAVSVPITRHIGLNVLNIDERR